MILTLQRAVKMVSFTLVGLSVGGCQTVTNQTKTSDVQEKLYDPQLEARVESILQSLTLEQKVGQMIQAEIGSVTIEDIIEYRIGSVLSGGGKTPNNNVQATAQEWTDYADTLFSASLQPADGIVPIPLMWGVDAVHGHGNAFGATLYPHNIGLGATRNAELVKQISQATATEVLATGLDWNFAPTVAVARDIRWGRTYESFSEDAELVAKMGEATVLGLQGKPGTPSFLNENHVLASAKHYIGDGGTQLGDDQGFVEGNEDALLAIHLPGYTSTVQSGVQTVMASYSWWNGIHSHENGNLINGTLKTELQFDGLVVSDWQAIGYVPGCSIDNCAKAVNAGIDLFMIPYAPDWKDFYRNTLEQVRRGEIAQDRIDDAVRRILRVKMRAGLWDKPSPQSRPLSGDTQLVGAPNHRALARQGVRESLVLLKNNGILPLTGNGEIVVAGPGADDLSMQTGGWSVSWQGTGNSNASFPGATSILAGLRQAVQSQGGQVIEHSKFRDDIQPSAAIVVFGETPYAEIYGDIQNLDTLEVEQHNKLGLATIQHYKNLGVPVVAVMLSGRPLWANKELNAADAFVAAWLPGTEGAGIADVLIGDSKGAPRFDFKGKLPFSWPAGVCDAHISKRSAGKALFPYGFGLSYEDQPRPWQTLSENTIEFPYGCILGEKIPSVETAHFNADAGWNYYIERKTIERRKVSSPKQIGALSARKNPDGSITARWDGSEMGRLTLRNGQLRNDLLAYLAHDGVVTMKIKLEQKANKGINAIALSGLSGGSYIDITQNIHKLPLHKWHDFTMKLTCFGDLQLDMNKVEVPFGIQTEGTLGLSIKEVKYLPDTDQPINVTCADESKTR